MYNKDKFFRGLFSEYDKNFIYHLYRSNTRKAIILSIIIFFMQISYLLIFRDEQLYMSIIVGIVFVMINTIFLLIFKVKSKYYSSSLYIRYMFFYAFSILLHSIYFSVKLQEKYTTFIPLMITFALVFTLINMLPMHTIIISFVSVFVFAAFLPGVENSKLLIFIDSYTFLIYSFIMIFISFTLLISKLKIYTTKKIFRDRSFALSEMSIKDALTGLYNHNYGLERLEEEINRRNRTNTELVLLLFDVDDFKGINDNYGHKEGDEVIRYIGGVLRKGIRKTDIAIRYGGDEFMVIFPYTKVESIIRVCEDIMDKISEYMLPDGEKITISGGLVQHGDEGVDEFFNEADKYMYKSKKIGKNRISFASGSLSEFRNID